jgi:hypothetical protein
MGSRADLFQASALAAEAGDGDRGISMLMYDVEQNGEVLVASRRSSKSIGSISGKHWHDSKVRMTADHLIRYFYTS